ncbi:MAG: tRNA (N(6)-L-threonylcarbamoyladenosine(37)-C(2))-methylthiotransferase MtaB [Ruminococcaceae bacterium]|nr:tRNA (N(6)-L-threonylcarbamoyladenosine(37)-C(2))-methylthiotransferase MtaB [Oscillospiraceae bacterium]
MKRVSFCTLGCKVNQYETEAMAQLFTNRGYEIADFSDVCDVYVINTCTVTGTGDKKSRQMIRRAKHLNPDAIIAVVGCYAQVAPEQVAAIEGVNVILGTRHRDRIVDMVEEASDGNTLTDVSDIRTQKAFEELTVEKYSEKTRAFIKIEDGCNAFCSYCIIPYARGPVRSRPIHDIVREAKTLAENGFSEVVLTGIHLASYGTDTKEHSLIDAVRAVHDIDGIRRIRLGSLEPRILTEEFIRAIHGLPKVCPHFHVSLQSGCTDTLKRMNRRYTAEEYREGVERLRNIYRNPAVTTDIMSGFPGETEEEFSQSLEFLKEIAFAEAHVFAYSNRKGTRADVMPEQVPKKVREERAALLSGAAAISRNDYIGSFVGEVCEVLFEQEIAPGVYEGYTRNYIRVHVESDTDLSHTYQNVTLTKAENGYAVGELAR